MTTKAQYITSVLTEIGRLDLVATGEEWFDDVYRMLNNYTDWSFLERRATRATVAGTYRYSLPADFRACSLLYLDTGDSQSRKIEYKSLAEFIQMYPRVEQTSSGVPVHRTTYNNMLLIAPKPSGVWTMNILYTYNPPAIASGQSPVFTDEFDHIMRSGLRGHAYARIKEYEKSKYNFDLFFTLMEQLSKKQSGEPEKDLMFLQPFRGNVVFTGEYWADPLIGLRG